MQTDSPRENQEGGGSLRLRLVLYAVGVLAISLGIVGMALNAAFRESAVAAERAAMEGLVYQVLAATEVGEDSQLRVEGELADPRLIQPQSGVYVRVHGENQQWLSPSTLGAGVPELPLASPGEVRWSEPWSGSDWFIFQYGIAWELADGSVRPYTVSVLSDPVAVAAKVAAFQQGIWRSLLAAGLILVIAQLFFLGIVLRPLRTVAKDVAQVESGAASRLTGSYPKELEPLSRNVNRLLATEQANRERYRNALDSLAHSLKTPLAVIRAALQESPADIPEPVEPAIDDMQRLIATRLQRAAGSTRRTMAQPVEVRGAVDRIIASVAKVHSHKMIEPRVTIPSDTRFLGEERDLLELLGNLVDNAFRYGRSRVNVSAGSPDSSDALWLRVEDDGPGIPEGLRDGLMKRGVRGDEREDGHGLGLAIVAELVQAYDGSLEFLPGELGGACIRVSFPGS